MAKKKPSKKKEPKIEYPPEFAGLFEKIPARDVEDAVAVCKEILAGGAGRIKKLVGLVGQEFGLKEGVKPKYALHGTVIYASRPGAYEDQELVATTLAGELAAGHSDELKAFLCRQLQLCGRAKDVPALAKLLGSDRLCEPATQAMLAIGGKEATSALGEALPAAKGKRRVTLLKAVGRQRDKDSAATARKAAGDAERDVRLMAYYALGNMGDADAVDLLLKAAAGREGFEHIRAAAESLRLARRLAEAGEAAGAEKAARGIHAAAKGPERVHERCAALHDLAMALGAKGVGELTAAMDSDELWYRNAAARTALKLAKAIRKDHKAEADKLLRKALKATKEKAVTQQAELMLAGTI